MTWLFTATILLSSCLLFLVQPICAKMLLPYLGGTPAVWNTCMVFFQTGLLLGYAYAHVAPRWLGLRVQAFVHLAALMGTYFLLPIRFPAEMEEHWHPVAWLLALLTLHAGLPFVLIASSGPLLQRWYAARSTATGRDPYFLYAASNLGSFLALGIFPFLLEPFFSSRAQSDLWRFGFLLLTALIAFCVPMRGGREALPEKLAADPTAAPNVWMRARWIGLALIPSSLLLSVTTHITTDIAAIPLLWLMPMGIYLLTYTLAFTPRMLVPHALLLRWLPLVVLIVTLVMLSEATEPLALVLGVHLLGLFWLALVCHGELARARPTASHLTDFYLCIAVGGMLGGVLNALVAPLIFSGLYEYPLMLVAAAYFGLQQTQRPSRSDWLWVAFLGMLTLALIQLLQTPSLALPPGPICVAAMFGLPLLLCYVLQLRAARFALGLGAIFLASGFYHGIHGASAYRERSYFGIHRVTQANGLHRLIHGNTVHGQQDFAHPRMPLTYYSEQGPIGDVFHALKNDPRSQRVGIIGLGAGTLAVYAEPGQDWTFFEIDPSVLHIAENPRWFTYLREARGTIHVELGDGRLQMQKSRQSFGLIVIDAFGSDAIPIHLLTREALQVYLDHLQPDGMIAFHISNKYVDLEPVLAALALAEHPSLACYVRADLNPSAVAQAAGVSPSVWLVLARERNDLGPLLRHSSWQPARTKLGVKAWSDEDSNLWKVFRWGE